MNEPRPFVSIAEVLPAALAGLVGADQAAQIMKQIKRGGK